jgi:hypothetical protein
MNKAFSTTSMITAIALAFLLSACGGGSSSNSNIDSSSPVATITVPSSVTGEQAGYAASVPSQDGCTYAWSITKAPSWWAKALTASPSPPGAAGP